MVAKKIHAKNSVDVRSDDDISMLNDILGNNKLTVILIYADYCGHCHKYKDDVWDSLVADENRKNGMASIHYDQLEKTPLANTKVSGYPTVLVLGENKTPINFKNKETGEEEVDYPESKNKENMSQLLNSEDPGSVLANNGKNSTDVVLKKTTDEPQEIDNASMEERLNSENAEAIVDSIVNKRADLKPKKTASVPNYRNDTNFEEIAGETPTPGKGMAGGGSLYKDLLESIKPARSHTRRARRVKKLTRTRTRARAHRKTRK